MKLLMESECMTSRLIDAFNGLLQNRFGKTDEFAFISPDFSIILNDNKWIEGKQPARWFSDNPHKSTHHHINAQCITIPFYSGPKMTWSNVNRETEPNKNKKKFISHWTRILRILLKIEEDSVHAFFHFADSIQDKAMSNEIHDKLMQTGLWVEGQSCWL
jgi:hypothetical protein